MNTVSIVASPPASSVLEERLERLIRLGGDDPGFFVLAIHSLIEGYLREVFDPYGFRSEEKFSAFIDQYRNSKDPSGTRLERGRDFLASICFQHDLTNKVRHNYEQLSQSDAISAIENLYNFLALERHSSSPALSKLQANRDLWNDKRTKADLIRELTAIGYKASSAEKNIATLMTEVETLRSERAESAILSSSISEYEDEIAKLKAANLEMDARYDEARSKKFEAETKLRALTKEMEAKRDAETYMARQRRLLGLSRSRKEYERFILRLTTEQREILDRIKLGESADFLVKGPAGTGKTLVLIKAIEKARGTDKLELDTGEGITVLLTFTRTLVKYDEYLSQLASENKGAHRIQTADSFLEDILHLINPRFRIDYENNTKFAKELASRHNTSTLKDDELATEIERFIYSNNVSRQEYVVEGIERKGMGRALPKEARAAVWDSLEAIEAELEMGEVFLKGYAAKRIIKALPQLKSNPDFPKVEYIFIDEVQDLSAAELMILKSCARKCLIMAGDEDQGIYRPGFSFARAGINVLGRSRSLGRNFRNSFPILELAERFRTTITGHEVEYEPDSDRPGDAPELFASADREALYSMLLKRVAYFKNEQQYEAENLFVIAPRNSDIEEIKNRLVRAGYNAKEPRDGDFDFSESGIIRVTTMHSAKGLDAPVVFLFLPTLPFIGLDYDRATTDKIHRDLLYVALTRAMDHLDIFVNTKSTQKAIEDLISFFPESNADFAPTLPTKETPKPKSIKKANGAKA